MPDFTPEQAIQVAKAAGLDTTELEQQIASGTAATSDLSEQITNLQAELQRRIPDPPPSPEQQERAMANRMLKHLNASITPWMEPGRD